MTVFALFPHWLNWVHSLWYPESGLNYAFFSSIAGTSIFSLGFVTWYRTHNCHAPGCPRIGHHPTADGLHKLCAVHHPDFAGKKRSLSEIHASHHAAKALSIVPPAVMKGLDGKDSQA